MNVLPEVDRERFERAISLTRIAGGGLALIVGFGLPNVGAGYVLTIGGGLLLYGLLAARLDQLTTGPAAQRRLSWAITLADSSFAMLAVLVFSSDPSWIVAPVAILLVVVSGFRLGRWGAVLAASVNTAAYIGGAWLRTAAFHYEISFPQVAFLIGLSWLTALLVATLVREAEALRRTTRDLYEPLLSAQSELGEMILVSEAGFAVYVSDALVQLTGFSRDQIKRTPLTQLFRQEGADLRARIGPGESWPRHFELPIVSARGRTTHLEVAATALPPLQGRDRHLFIARDITDRVHAIAEIERMALHDTVTGLPNKILVRDRLERRLLRASVEHESVAVLYVDMDRFKDFNDSFGHRGGDALLAGIAARLRDALDPLDTLARFEGDEFVAMIAADAEGARARAELLLTRLAEGLVVRGETVHPEATVGIAIAPAADADAETLLRNAEAAMYRAKRTAVPILVHTEVGTQTSGDRVTLMSDLRHAIERGELWLAYQPIVAIATGVCVSVECLLRWKHPTRGAVPPLDFIPIAEDSGIIRQIGLWVLSQATQACVSWGRDAPGVSVNLSVRNLRMPELHSAIATMLEMWNVPSGALTIEVTESLLMDDRQRIGDLLRDLQTLGVRASIDDYGTGYSSLAYLKQLPVRELKIDRAFVSDLADPQSAAIVRSTIQLAHELGLLVVAEGIEDQSTWDTLRRLGCDLAQGYFIARPMPGEELRTWLRQRPPITRLNLISA